MYRRNINSERVESADVILPNWYLLEGISVACGCIVFGCKNEKKGEILRDEDKGFKCWH